MNIKIIIIFEVVAISYSTCYSTHENVPDQSLSKSASVSSPISYNGGMVKIMVHYLLTNNQKEDNKVSERNQLSHLFPWRKFNDFFLNGFNQHFDKVDYSPQFAMKPRKTGMLYAIESSDWYQQLTSHCVDWNPDSYSFNGALCNGMKYFGINVFKGVITFSDLITCSMIGYTTGDGLFCLTWYLGRFFLNDYLPDSLKEQYHYANGRLRHDI